MNSSRPSCWDLKLSGFLDTQQNMKGSLCIYEAATPRSRGDFGKYLDSLRIRRMRISDFALLGIQVQGFRMMILL